MNVNHLFNELLELKRKGHGTDEVVIMEKLLGEKPYQTTVENIEVTTAEWNKEKSVVLLYK